MPRPRQPTPAALQPRTCLLESSFRFSFAQRGLRSASNFYRESVRLNPIPRPQPSGLGAQTPRGLSVLRLSTKHCAGFFLKPSSCPCLSLARLPSLSEIYVAIEKGAPTLPGRLMLLSYFLK